MKKPKATRGAPVEVKGKQGFEYSDGSIRDALGHVLTKPAYPKLMAAEIVTADQGRQMAERRVSLSRERTRQGIRAGLGLPQASGGAEWAELTRLFVEQFAKSKNLRGMAESYEKLGKASGYMVEEPPPNESVVLMVLRMFERLEGDVVEGDVK